MTRRWPLRRSQPTEQTVGDAAQPARRPTGVRLLIRKFINPRAVIRYSDAPLPDEVAFDMSRGPFSHHGNLCTFETMVRASRLDDPAVGAIAEIVHEIDLRDGRYARPEVPGIDAVLRGWMSRADAARDTHGVALFDGLYAALSQMTSRGRARKRGDSAQRKPI
jgi:hypothetical protein